MLAGYSRVLLAWAALFVPGIAVVPGIAGAQDSGGSADPSEADSGDVSPEATDPGREPVTQAGVAPNSIDLMDVVRGQGQPWTAERAAERAVATGPSVDRARALMKQAEAGVTQAFVGFLPRLDLTGQYTRLSGITNPSLFQGPSDAIVQQFNDQVANLQDPAARDLWSSYLTYQASAFDFEFPVILNQWLFRATVSYPVSDVLLTVLPNYEAAEKSAKAQRYQAAAEASRVALSARETFYSYVRARGSLAVALSTLEQAQAQHKQVSAFVAAGSAPRVDLMRVEAVVASAEVGVARAEGGVNVAATALRSLLHVKADIDLAVGEDILQAPPAPAVSREQLVTQALHHRAETKALLHAMQASGQRVRAAEASRWPHLGVAGNIDYSNPNPRIIPQVAEFRDTWAIGATLTWSPNDLVSAEAQISQAKSQQAQAKADLRSLEDAIRVEVNEAYENLRSSRKAVEAAHKGMAAADESYRVREIQYKAGAAVLNDVIDASTEQVRARLQLVNAAVDTHQSWARLQRAIGADAASIVK